MVPKLGGVSSVHGKRKERFPRRHVPESPLDALNVVLKPVALGNVLLANRHTSPLDAHDRDVLNIVLVELDLQRRVVTGRPLVQPPALDDLSRLLQLEILAGDVSAEQLKLATLLGSFEDLGRSPGERGQPLGVREGLVKLGGSGAELLVVGDGCGVDDLALVCLGLGGGRRCRRVGRGDRNVLGGGETAGWVGAGCMLDVLAVFSDQSRGELGKLLPQLRNDLGPDELLDRLLLLGVGVDVNLELCLGLVCMYQPSTNAEAYVPRTRLPLCHGQPPGW